MVDIASTAALLADPTRSRMLTALMDGRALTATELALEGGILPSTASSHLARLTQSGVLEIAKQGRHRYFRIATPDVARAVETLMGLATHSPKRVGPTNHALRRARVCYDHLAGEVAVELLARMRKQRFVRETNDTLALTAAGEAWLTSIGVDLAALRARRRPLCRPCLDWSERRSHLAGAVGAALLDRLFVLRYARRELAGRAITFTPRGEAFLAHLGGR